jgi:hypothetical protein
MLGIVFAGLAVATLAGGYLVGTITSPSTSSAQTLVEIENRARASLNARVIASEARLTDGGVAPTATRPRAARAGDPAAPAGGGFIPTTDDLTDPQDQWRSRAQAADAFGTSYGYCAPWNNAGVATGGNAAVHNAGLLNGRRVDGAAALGGTPTSRPMLAVISAGRDRTFQTTCVQALQGLSAGDDAVNRIMVAEVRDIDAAWRQNTAEAGNQTRPTASLNLTDPNVRLGVRTNTPSAAVDVDGDVRIRDDLAVTGTAVLNSMLQAGSLALATPLAVSSGGLGGSTVPTAQAAMGAGTVGQGLIAATTPAGARTTLGFGTVGSQIAASAVPADVWDVTGVTVIGRDVLTSSNPNAALQAMGASSLGTALLQTPSVASALSILAIPPFGQSLLGAADAVAARALMGTGTMAVQDAASVAITGGSASGVALGGVVLSGTLNVAPAAQLGTDTNRLGTVRAANIVGTIVATQGGGNVAGVVPIEQGGSNSSTAALARAALGMPGADGVGVTGTWPIDIGQGGGGTAGIATLADTAGNALAIQGRSVALGSTPAPGDPLLWNGSFWRTGPIAGAPGSGPPPVSAPSPANCSPGEYDPVRRNCIFRFSGQGQVWTVPAGVTQFEVKMWGAGGGVGQFQTLLSGTNPYIWTLQPYMTNPTPGALSPVGGAGGYVSGIVSTTSGTQFTLYVGQGGNNGSCYTLTSSLNVYGNCQAVTTGHRNNSGATTTIPQVGGPGQVTTTYYAGAGGWPYGGSAANSSGFSPNMGQVPATGASFGGGGGGFSALYLGFQSTTNPPTITTNLLMLAGGGGGGVARNLASFGGAGGGATMGGGASAAATANGDARVWNPTTNVWQVRDAEGRGGAPTASGGVTPNGGGGFGGCAFTNTQPPASSGANCTTSTSPVAAGGEPGGPFTGGRSFGGGGGGSGFFGGGGGSRLSGPLFGPDAGGGGGGSSFVNGASVSGTSVTGGTMLSAAVNTPWNPPASSDPDFRSFRPGRGGLAGDDGSATPGNNGLIVICWPTCAPTVNTQILEWGQDSVRIAGGIVGQAYSTTLSAPQSTGTPTYALRPGAPAWMSLSNPSSPTITGTPTGAGTFTATVRASLSTETFDDINVVMLVAPAGGPSAATCPPGMFDAVNLVCVIDPRWTNTNIGQGNRPDPIGVAWMEWAVPSGVTELRAKLWAGGGGTTRTSSLGSGSSPFQPTDDPVGANGGAGGFLKSRITVTPGETLVLTVASGSEQGAAPWAMGGGAPNEFFSSSATLASPSPRSCVYDIPEGGMGGGVTAVSRRVSASNATPLAVAGGGGGAWENVPGGDGGTASPPGPVSTCAGSPGNNSSATSTGRVTSTSDTAGCPDTFQDGSMPVMPTNNFARNNGCPVSGTFVSVNLGQISNGGAAFASPCNPNSLTGDCLAVSGGWGNAFRFSNNGVIGFTQNHVAAGGGGGWRGGGSGLGGGGGTNGAAGGVVIEENLGGSGGFPPAQSDRDYRPGVAFGGRSDWNVSSLPQAQAIRSDEGVWHNMANRGMGGRGLLVLCWDSCPGF